MIIWKGNRGSVEASDLGWAPGVWPTVLTIEDDDEHPRHFHRVHEFRVTVETVTYAASDGSTIEVFND